MDCLRLHSVKKIKKKKKSKYVKQIELGFLLNIVTVTKLFNNCRYF